MGRGRAGMSGDHTACSVGDSLRGRAGRAEGSDRSKGREERRWVRTCSERLVTNSSRGSGLLRRNSVSISYALRRLQNDFTKNPLVDLLLDPYTGGGA
jgi:hypothetical protein